ncbi:MAG: LysE family translocator [Rhizobiales bacterium]|nr:LysE family translocator [Hyphomicrobiales bacterium]MBI3674959.1 LysE family translocator [Hyphomicrobiales bacterium]
MTAELFAALVTFAFVAAATPGPNNLMLLSSGVNFGFRRKVPHMLGIGFGFTFMIVVVGIGLGPIFARYPQIYGALRWMGGLYMLWLAWKIANSGPVGDGRGGAQPMTFIKAALFQWVNPKGWAMMVSAIATYTLAASYVWSVLLVAAVFGAVTFPSISSWALFGVALQRVLNHPTYRRAFNIAMALLLVASLTPLFWH